MDHRLRHKPLDGSWYNNNPRVFDVPVPGGSETRWTINLMSSFVFARPLTKYGRVRPVGIGRGRSQSVRPWSWAALPLTMIDS